jgi:hypothetical protein
MGTWHERVAGAAEAEMVDVADGLGMTEPAQPEDGEDGVSVVEDLGGNRRREIIFLASLPTIMSAVRFSGDGSVRIQLDVPAMERMNMMPLLALTDTVFEVVVRPRWGLESRPVGAAVGTDAEVAGTGAADPEKVGPWDLQVLEEVGKQLRGAKPRKR